LPALFEVLAMLSVLQSMPSSTGRSPVHTMYLFYVISMPPF
jgi:hypothetical protein